MRWRKFVIRQVLLTSSSTMRMRASFKVASFMTERLRVQGACLNGGGRKECGHYLEEHHYKTQKIDVHIYQHSYFLAHPSFRARSMRQEDAGNTEFVAPNGVKKPRGVSFGAQAKQ